MKANRGTHPWQRDLALRPARQIENVRARGDILQVRREEPTARRRHTIQRFVAFWDDCNPVRFGRVGGVEQHHPAIGRVPIGEHQQLVADVVDHRHFIFKGVPHRPKISLVL